MASDLEKLSKMVQDFCRDRDWDQYHGPKDLAIGLVTEASELLELFRFQDPQQCQALLQAGDSREAVADELADVLFFLLRFSQRNQFDLLGCLQNKLVKNSLKYPVEKCHGSNSKYDKLE